MQAINHTVFGSLIATTISEPAIALPLALASHFLMDAIPHYGEDPKAPRGSKAYYIRIAADLLASVIVLLFFLSLHPAHAWLLGACVVVAVMPDFLWPFALFVKQKGPLWAFFRFHKRIQTESRAGIFVEIGWFAITTSLVVYRLHPH
jgi:hypothetical protein